MRMMPWRSSSSVFTVLVNELACCSESLARVEVTAIVLRLLVPRCIERVVLIATAPTVMGSEIGRLVVVSTQREHEAADRNGRRT